MSFLAKAFYVDDLIKHKGANVLQYPNVTEINDVVYDESVCEVCKLDLLFDENKLPASGIYPVVFNIHGGGWITGDKRFRRGVCIQFANDGNFVVNVNYALTPKYTYGDEVRNIFSALNWVKANAEKYKLDLNKLVITGDSAGAQLSAVTIVTNKDTNWQQKFGVEATGLEFRGAMLFCGPYDFTEFWFRFPVLDAMLKGIAGIKRVKDYEKSEYVDFLNPIPYINKDFPRTLVVTGAQDFVTNPHNKKLLKRFDEVGVDYERYHGTNFFNSFHDFHLKIWMPEAKRAMKTACEYIKKVTE